MTYFQYGSLNSVDVLARLALVNGYYQAHAPANATNNDWTGGVYMVGNLAHYTASGNASLLSYATTWGEAHAWKLTGYRNCHGALGCPDNIIAGFSYATLENLTAGGNFTAALNAAADTAMANGVCAVATNASLAKSSDDCWWWADALYMALPTYACLGTTAHDRGDVKRAEAIWDFARSMYNVTAFGVNTSGARAFDLWSPDASLFWRDVSYVTKHAANGKPVFWSRANGWAFAAFARTLEALPDSADVRAADRAEWEGKMRLMATKLVTLQGADGCWRSQLEDAAQFPQIETSGTSLILYGLAYGVNAGVFGSESDVFEQAALKAWKCMNAPSPQGAVLAEGRIGWCQPGGAGPNGNFGFNSTDDYCVGAFLLGGSELVKLLRSA